MMQIHGAVLQTPHLDLQTVRIVAQLNKYKMNPSLTLDDGEWNCPEAHGNTFGAIMPIF